jgi:hypothetical protein
VAELSGDFTISRARMDETPTGTETDTADRGTVELGPGEIATFRLRPQA